MSDLAGQFLIAMPNMSDERFKRAVIFLHHHDREGAVGFVVNKPMPMTYDELFDAVLDTDDESEGAFGVRDRQQASRQVGYGGPVEESRGFVLSVRNAGGQAAIEVDARLESLRALMGSDDGGSHLVVLGYAGWGEGQLESELAKNVWLSGPMDPLRLFSADIENRYELAMQSIGIDLNRLVSEPGRA